MEYAILMSSLSNTLLIIYLIRQIKRPGNTAGTASDGGRSNVIYMDARHEKNIDIEEES